MVEQSAACAVLLRTIHRGRCRRVQHHRQLLSWRAMRGACRVEHHRRRHRVLPCTTAAATAPLSIAAPATTTISAAACAPSA